MNTQLYTTLADVLNMIPTVIIEHIIIQYLTPQYLYSIETPTLFYTFHFNKQLSIIYCASETSYKLIDYNTRHLHDSSIINVSKFDSEFVHIFDEYSFVHNIVHFDDNDIIINTNSDTITKYSLCDQRYVLTQRNGTGYYYCKPCIYNQRIYILSITNAGYLITVYDYHNLSKIKQSYSYSYAYNNECHVKFMISIHNDILYVYREYLTKILHNISMHDVITLKAIDNRIFRRDIKHDTITIHENKIYTYGLDTVHIYDAMSLNEIQSFYTKSFKNPGDKHRISVSNGLLAISNHEEMMIYDKIEI